MIKIEGYKVFSGTMEITPLSSSRVTPYILNGDFLYKPDMMCWYHGGSSYPEEVCKVVDDRSHHYGKWIITEDSYKFNSVKCSSCERLIEMYEENIEFFIRENSYCSVCGSDNRD
jgi:hypothetical protein